MLTGRRPWREELAIIDNTMRAISGIRDPEEFVSVYWQGIGELMPIDDFVSVSRRGVEAPDYLVTRSSRFTQHFNPWTERDKLPRLRGGLLGEIAYANAPVIIDDLPSRLAPDDPGYFYLQGFKSLVALPQYDNNEGINATAMLLPAGVDLDKSIIPLLHWQSGLFGRGTQNLVLRNQLDDALASLERELQTVAEIQRSLLPQELPDIAGFDVAAHYHTSARAGGDYYDFFPLENGQWGIFIADVSGHGTPAAVLMAITHAIAHSQPGSHTPPAALLTYLNNELTRSYTSAGTFVTAFYGVLDPRRRLLTYSVAGHNPPRLQRGHSVISVDGASALPMGIMLDQMYSESHIELAPHDMLLLYTDGITEAMSPSHANPPRDMFGTHRLDQILMDHRDASAEQCVANIREAVHAHTEGSPSADDQTIIAMRCN